MTLVNRPLDMPFPFRNCCGAIRFWNLDRFEKLRIILFFNEMGNGKLEFR
jgi:hypothetical protein